MDKEEAKLGLTRRINHVFDLMGVEYDDRPILVELKDDASDRAKGKKPISTKGNKATKAKVQRPIARKRKASEHGDVRLGLELAKPSKKSRKFTLGGSPRESEMADAERISEGSSVSFSCMLLMLIIYSDELLSIYFLCLLFVFVPSCHFSF